MKISEIETLLQNLEPEQIRAQKAADLDARGLAFLQKTEKELDEVRSGLNGSAREFRKAQAPMPDVRLPADFSSFDPMPRRPRHFSNAFLTLAAVFVLAVGGLASVSLQNMWSGKTGKTPFQHKRGVGSHAEQTRSHYQDLFDSLMSSGNSLFEIGRIENQREIYSDALDLFLKAHKLNPKEARAIRALIRTYEALGDETKMQEFETMLKVLEMHN